MAFGLWDDAEDRIGRPQDIAAQEDSHEETEGFQEAYGDGDVESAQLTSPRPVGDFGVKDVASRLPQSIQAKPLEKLQAE